MLKARAVVENLKEYHPPLGRREGLAARFQRKRRRMLAARAARAGHTFRPKFSTSIRSGKWASSRWPSYLGVAIDRLLLTNGVDEAIHLLCETYLEPGDEALIVVPTFSLYEIYALATGAKVVNVQAGEDFAFPARKVLAGDHSGDQADHARHSQQSDGRRGLAPGSVGDRRRRAPGGVAGR